jgi:coproporphyrinogen III oxidase-like Fe-S oxidoreductase
VGPGAHGRLDLGGKRFATSCERLPERWRDLVMRSGHGVVDMQEVVQADAAHEHLLMNMRLTEGLDLIRYESRWAAPLDSARIAALENEGLVHLANGTLAATSRGRLVLNSVIAALAD